MNQEFTCMKTVIESWAFEDMQDLGKIIELAKIAMKNEGADRYEVVYVGTNNNEPTQFRRAELIKFVLTDGSFVFDLRLS